MKCFGCGIEDDRVNKKTDVPSLWAIFHPITFEAWPIYDGVPFCFACKRAIELVEKIRKKGEYELDSDLAGGQRG